MCLFLNELRINYCATQQELRTICAALVQITEHT